MRVSEDGLIRRLSIRLLFSVPLYPKNLHCRVGSVKVRFSFAFGLLDGRAENAGDNHHERGNSSCPYDF